MWGGAARSLSDRGGVSPSPRTGGQSSDRALSLPVWTAFQNTVKTTFTKSEMSPFGVPRTGEPDLIASAWHHLTRPVSVLDFLGLAAKSRGQ